MTNSDIGFNKVLILRTNFRKCVLIELEQVKDNPAVDKLIELGKQVYDLQRRVQVVKGDGQAAKIQTDKLEKEIGELRGEIELIKFEG